MTMDILTAKNKKNVIDVPEMSREEYRSFASRADHKQKIRSRTYITKRDMPPIKPNSSAKVVKIKSVCFSGRKFNLDCVPCIKPLPLNEPEPRAILDWVMWYPAPKGSFDGSINVSIRRY